jgi:purine-binding chemotaxis protein CheW
MLSLPYVVFRLQGVQYAVNVETVQEIIPLPEITPVAETPPYFAGVIHLRGSLVSVLHLAPRLGLPPQPYRLSDRVLIFRDGGRLYGIIVDEVLEVQSFAPEEMESAPTYGQEELPDERFIERIAKTPSGIVGILHIERLLRLPEEVVPSEEDTEESVIPSLDVSKSRFFERTLPEDRELFRERARLLALPVQQERSEEQTAIAVVQLGEEYLGVDLLWIREFTHSRNVTPVPCCPPHILGCMNLRGELVTLVDIREALSLPVLQNPIGSVMVTQASDFTLGIAVDEVLEVVHLASDEILPLPSGLNPEHERYLKGAAAYQGHMMSLMDLPKLLKEGNLEVDENV